MNTGWPKAVILSATFLITMPGCMDMTAHVSPNYTPEPSKRSPLSTIHPLAISLRVEDQRDPGERDRLGDTKNGLGIVVGKVSPYKDPTMILYEALTNEFEHNAHKIIEPENGQADVSIKIALKRYWTDLVIHFVDIEMKGTLDTDIAILNGIDRGQVASIPINSTFRESRQFGGTGAFESALNGALREFVRSFSRDPNILDSLRSVASRKNKG